MGLRGNLAVAGALELLPPIPEVHQKTHASYAPGTIEACLYPLVESHDVFVIGGAFFGDEGKGKITAAIAGHPDVSLVARVNSGANAGHTVIIDGEAHAFHLVPSAIAEQGVMCAIGPNCLMDPVAFIDGELANLAGVDYHERLLVGNAHLTAPYHLLMDVMRNLRSGVTAENVTTNNASTLKGIAPTSASKVNKTCPRMDDLDGSISGLAALLAKDSEAYRGMAQVRGYDAGKLLAICSALNRDMRRVPDQVLEFLDATDPVQYIVQRWQALRSNPLFPRRANVPHLLRQTLASGDKVLLEGPQSYFLSNAVAQHARSATSADTTAAGIVAASGINLGQYRILTVNVAKAPGASRVGRGANPAGHVHQTFYSDAGINTLNDLPQGACNDFDAIQRQYAASVRHNGTLRQTEYTDATGTYLIGAAMAIAEAQTFGERGATTRKPRVTGLFDCVTHAEVMRAQGPYTVISAVDRGDAMDMVGVVIAYVYHHPDGEETSCEGQVYRNGDIIRPGDPMPYETVLGSCHPIIKMVQGWKGTPIAADKWDASQGLPLGVQEFVGTIEQATGAKVMAIGNGPETDSLIYLAAK
ncbi:hypothetical protein AUJ68_01425 [Candidatus Woesearchaeota archaeon CG1_02_57_44]|nr:MAG: hypothetical protein AUJ68_01425 [Candidatus Woesearchaeota archaeon CG1_02_57_44]